MAKKKQKKEDAAVCLKCGESLRSGARFCGACGTEAGTTKPSSAETTQRAGAASQLRGPVIPPLEATTLQTPITAPPGLSAFTSGAGAAMGIVSEDGLGEQPRFSTAQRTAERADRVATAAKWTGATRQVLIDKNPHNFSGAVREILDMIEPFTVERDQFQNIMFIKILAMSQRQDLMPAVNAAIALLPVRFKPFLADPSRINSLDFGGPWKEIFEGWPYATFEATWDIPDDQLREICIQTIYEGAFILNLAPNGYLEDEEVRLESGLYPNSFKPVVQRAYAKCHGVKTDEWGSSADQRADNLLGMIAPMGHPKVYQDTYTMLATKGLAMPVPPENLTDWELQHLHAFAKDQGYNRQEVLSVLISRWESLSGHLSRMDESLRYFFLLQHFMLSLCLNMHSRRNDPKLHKDYGNFLASGGPFGPDYTSIFRKGAEEKVPHLVRCLWPSKESLFLLEYRLNRQLAVQAAQSAPPPPPPPKAKPANEQARTERPTPPPPPPGRGPGVHIAGGGVYYPMLPEIPLTPEGAGVRQQAMDLAFELMEFDLTGNEDYSVECELTLSKLRKIVSTNLAAFGLTEKRYMEFDDKTLHQYLFDIVK